MERQPAAGEVAEMLSVPPWSVGHWAKEGRTRHVLTLRHQGGETGQSHV